MASHRPGFARTNTERHEGNQDIELQDTGAGSSKAADSYDFRDRDVKDGTALDVQPVRGESPPEYEDAGDGFGKVTQPVETAKDLVTQVLHVDDDPSLNPYTFRVFFLGTGLAIFGSVLQEIFYFKPQTIYVSVVFLCVIAYVLGEFMAFAIPRKLAFLNPGPFNQKEHAAITIMASAAAQCAVSTEALAAQQLFYGGYPSRAAGIFVTLSSQLIGYGIAGMLRDVLVYPTRMLWPINLPVATLLETLHRDKVETRRKLKVFYIIFGIIFVWEAFPEYIFTVLTGVSIFCLADQKNLVFTNLFGGASGNEGLGMLSICFDWNYIAGLWSPLWYPLQTLVNNMIGIIGCYIMFMGVYYGNVWRSLDFPFLSQELFDGSSNATNYVIWNQSLVLNDKFEIDQAKLAHQGIPYLTGTYISYLITSNMGLTATLTHMLLWNFDDIKAGWAWAAPKNLKKLLKAETWLFWKKPETPEQRFARKQNDPELDPHYKLMMRNLYKETPMWWWAAVLVAAWVVGIACLYVMKSTLPWWGFLLSTILTSVFMLFFGAQMGITGFQFNIQPICQMLAGYLFPGRPLANFYFTCYTFNALQMGELLAKDLKLAQYAHLPPQCTFLVQVLGCVVGALFNWIMMISIVENQAPILNSIQGSNIWSGQNIQQFNTLAIAWSIADKMFSVGTRYQWVTLSFLIGFVVPLPFYIAHRYTGWRFFSYINLSIILWYMGNLFVGINSSLTSFFIIGFVAQWWFRKYRPQLFVKYNYLVSAALDGGTQVLVFIFTFAVFGGSGKQVPFPTWAGNPDTDVHNIDYCMTFLITVGSSVLAAFLTAAPYYADQHPMLQRLTHFVETVTVPTIPQLAAIAIRKMSTSNGTPNGTSHGPALPSDWHTSPDDSFHGKITKDGPFQPEADRYHLYIGLFCPFAHRANIVRKLKQLDKYAGIDISIVKAYPKDVPGKPSWPGWRFNHKDESHYEGATEDKLFGSRFMNEIYFRADPDYKGKYSVPVLWDKKLNTIVNNESAELLRDLQTAFNELLPEDVAEQSLYPSELQKDIGNIADWMGANFNAGVYKTGFAPNQEVYDKNLPPVFASLNKMEKIAKQHGGPYILGEKMTEIDVRAYATVVRFDTVYVQHFKCNLGTIRNSYPVLNNWLKGMYFNQEPYRNTTDFRHIKENYTKSHYEVNPTAITPMGPWPDVEEGYEGDWSKLQPGSIDMPAVLEAEKKFG